GEQSACTRQQSWGFTAPDVRVELHAIGEQAHQAADGLEQDVGQARRLGHWDSQGAPMGLTKFLQIRVREARAGLCELSDVAGHSLGPRAISGASALRVLADVRECLHVNFLRRFRTGAMAVPANGLLDSLGK